jgi:curved DNA-binding protein CbpA
MNDPYETLGLLRDAGEPLIRRRYLELVREFPPDRAPERFAAIHAAYEALRDPAQRVHSQIFQYETTDDSLEAIASDLIQRVCHARLPVDVLLKLAESP